MPTLILAAMALAAAPAPPTPTPTPIPASFASDGADRAAIDALLATYTRAVSTKDRALFETLLLNREVPFAGVRMPSAATAEPGATRQYAGFAHDVFDGPAFTQRFQDVHVDQDGPLASVALVFVNTAPGGTSWGWKTMQLIKVDGRWKIASEFYTGHPG